MKRSFSFLAIALMTLFFCHSGYADDIYNDEHWKIDSNGVSKRVSSSVSAGREAITEVFATGDTLTGTESGKVCILDVTGSASTALFSLPIATQDLVFTIVAADNTTLIVDPSGTDRISYLTLSAGDKIQSTGATADSVTLVCGQSNIWYVADMKGSWIDAN